MIQDLSFIHEKTPEEQEEAIKQAVANECLRAIVIYLTEVAETMEVNNIECLNSATVRSMAGEFSKQLTENAQNQD
jgi:hypothetical protein